MTLCDTGNIVNDIMITMYGVKRILELLRGSLCGVTKMSNHYAIHLVRIQYRMLTVIEK